MRQMKHTATGSSQTCRICAPTSFVDLEWIWTNIILSSYNRQMPDSFAALEVTAIQNILDIIQCNELGNGVFKAEMKCIV